MTKTPQNLFLFYGDEDFLIDREVKNCLPSDASKANIETLDGGKAEISDIIHAISSSSLFSSNKVVIIKDAYFFKAPKRSQKDEENDKIELDQIDEENEDDDASSIDVLISSFSNIPQTTTVFFLSYGKVDGRKKIFKAIQKLGEVREFRSFTDWNQEKVLPFIVELAKGQGKKIGSRACALLMEISGRSLMALSLEIEKISTYVGEKDTIVEDDVRVMASQGSLSVFALLESLKKRDISSALESLNKLIKNREAPQSLLGLVATQFRMMLQIKAFNEKGLSEREIVAELKASPVFIGKCAEGARMYSQNELKRAIFLLHDTDMKIKSGYSPAHVHLELMLIEMLSGSSQGQEAEMKR